MKSNFLMLGALILGTIYALFGAPIIVADTITELFMNGLKVISMPIVFLSIVSTLASMETLSNAAKILRNLLKYTILTTLLAAAIGLALFLIIDPVNTTTAATTSFSAPSGTYLSFLMKIIPTNPIEPFVEGNVLAVASMATILGIAIIKLPEEHGKPLKSFFTGLFQTLLKISSWAIKLIPLAVFGFTIQFVYALKTSQAELRPLLLYATCVIVANVIQGAIVLPLLLKRKGISPIKLFKAMLPALATAFFTKSSSAALPLTLKCAQERAGISTKTSSFSLPLCSVINMNGCAAFILITVLFVSLSSGMTLGIMQMIPWIAIASLAAIGNAGVPMGCFFLTTAFLVGMGVPLTLLGLILPLYAIFDMVETALNVWSDSCVTAITDKNLAAIETTHQLS